MTTGSIRRLCIAPMMDRTDRHFRFLMRLIAPGAYLYTEMVTSAALVRGDSARWLRHDAAEHPVAFQLGGSDPEELAAAARLAAGAGFDEINLNVGCPSDRVQAGQFGAALMLERDRVADSVRAMSEAVSVPVTVKTRLGVDDHDDYGFLCRFVDAVVGAGCRTLIVHARKAWLKGLSPKQNREVPPLDYARVYRLKADFPALEVIINGGVRSAAGAADHLGRVDGVMIGRAAYEEPLLLADIEHDLECRKVGLDGLSARCERQTVRERVLERYVPYMRQEIAAGTRLRSMTRHLMGLLHGEPGARQWRRELGALEEDAAGLERFERLITRHEGRRNRAGKRFVHRGDGTGYNAVTGNP